MDRLEVLLSASDSYYGPYDPVESTRPGSALFSGIELRPIQGSAMLHTAAGWRVDRLSMNRPFHPGDWNPCEAVQMSFRGAPRVYRFELDSGTAPEYLASELESASSGHSWVVTSGERHSVGFHLELDPSWTALGLRAGRRGPDGTMAWIPWTEVTDTQELHRLEFGSGEDRLAINFESGICSMAMKRGEVSGMFVGETETMTFRFAAGH